MSALGDFLNSINKKGGNIVRGEQESPRTVDVYPAFPARRLLSYHSDAILFVNEVNVRGATECRVTPLMEYEFFYYVLPKKSRFARMAKPEDDEKVNLIMEVYKYSRRKAEQVKDIISETGYDKLRESRETGGKV